MSLPQEFCKPAVLDAPGCSGDCAGFARCGHLLALQREFPLSGPDGSPRVSLSDQRQNYAGTCASVRARLPFGMFESSQPATIARLQPLSYGAQERSASGEFDSVTPQPGMDATSIQDNSPGSPHYLGELTEETFSRQPALKRNTQARLLAVSTPTSSDADFSEAPPRRSTFIRTLSKVVSSFGAATPVAAVQEEEGPRASRETTKQAPGAIDSEDQRVNKRRALIVYDAVRDGSGLLQLKGLYIDPRSPFREKWDSLMFTFIVYTVLMIPYSIAFEPDRPPAIEILEAFIDAFFIMDIFLNFATAFYDSSGLLVANNRLIVQNYLKLWFYIDFAASIPIESFIALLGKSFANASNLSLLKATRLLRFGRVFKASSVKGGADRENLQRIITLVGSMSLILHWLTCVWHLVCTNSVESGLCDSELQETAFESYLISFYIVLVATLGDTVTVHSKQQLTLVVILSFFGSFMLAIVFGAMANLVQQLNKKQMEHTAATSSRNDLMCYLKVPGSLQERIRQYFQYMWLRGLQLPQRPLAYLRKGQWEGSGGDAGELPRTFEKGSSRRHGQKAESQAVNIDQRLNPKAVEVERSLEAQAVRAKAEVRRVSPQLPVACAWGERWRSVARGGGFQGKRQNGREPDCFDCGLNAARKEPDGHPAPAYLPPGPAAARTEPDGPAPSLPALRHLCATPPAQGLIARRQCDPPGAGVLPGMKGLVPSNFVEAHPDCSLVAEFVPSLSAAPRVVQAMNSTIALPGELLMKKGKHASGLFFISRGQCEILAAPGLRRRMIEYEARRSSVSASSTSRATRMWRKVRKSVDIKNKPEWGSLTRLVKIQMDAEENKENILEKRLKNMLQGKNANQTAEDSIGLFTGDCFGQISLLCNTPSAISVIATTFVDLHVLSSESFKEIVRENGMVAVQLRRMCADTALKRRHRLMVDTDLRDRDLVDELSQNLGNERWTLEVGQRLKEMLPDIVLECGTSTPDLEARQCLLSQTGELVHENGRCNHPVELVQGYYGVPVSGEEAYHCIHEQGNAEHTLDQMLHRLASSSKGRSSIYEPCGATLPRAGSLGFKVDGESPGTRYLRESLLVGVSCGAGALRLRTLTNPKDASFESLCSLAASACGLSSAKGCHLEARVPAMAGVVFMSCDADVHPLMHRLLQGDVSKSELADIFIDLVSRSTETGQHGEVTKQDAVPYRTPIASDAESSDEKISENYDHGQSSDLSRSLTVSEQELEVIKT
ncbi:hypothetical protein CYMTET_50834 [Cymbomonas tetramitiformis]|uniref:Cyclic nucleotide-binding domain-containing protein n=1 Tax=Cymbomonas tetramitiformis TaxID=36881 RepID=A0AAE0BNF9_9CHLO|nr:hypothetical protein CYMTET_50834 [Cymbomonas tetramitiformis]